MSKELTVSQENKLKSMLTTLYVLRLNLQTRATIENNFLYPEVLEQLRTQKRLIEKKFPEFFVDYVSDTDIAYKHMPFWGYCYYVPIGTSEQKTLEIKNALYGKGAN